MSSEPTAVAPSTWPWPSSLDALVAAPQHHALLLENEWVRVLDTRISPGVVVPVHTHRCPAVYYVVSWSDFVRRDADGNVVLDSRVIEGKRPPSIVGWSPPLPPHSLENVGAVELRVICVELKQVAA